MFLNVKQQKKRVFPLAFSYAAMAKLAYALDLGSSGVIRAGSTPVSRTICPIGEPFEGSPMGTYMLFSLAWQKILILVSSPS